jgi:hypothetical protein
VGGGACTYTSMYAYLGGTGSTGVGRMLASGQQIIIWFSEGSKPHTCIELGVKILEDNWSLTTTKNQKKIWIESTFEQKTKKIVLVVLCSQITIILTAAEQ